MSSQVMFIATEMVFRRRFKLLRMFAVLKMVLHSGARSAKSRRKTVSLKLRRSGDANGDNDGEGLKVALVETRNEIR